MADITVANGQKSIVDATMARIDELSQSGGIVFPPNYSAANAIRSAYLEIQEVKDINGKPALDVCTRESVLNALFYTAIMGLNPAKKQVYYIVYGNKLQAQRSYFGTMVSTKRVPGVKDIWADVVYEGDSFKATKKRGSWEITEHVSDFGNIDSGKIVGAYCTIEKEDGSSFTEVMNWAQIQQSWAKARSKAQTVHKEFPDQMAKRTVINRACKIFFNTSDDSDLLIEAFNATGEQYDHDGDQQPATRPVSGRQAALNSMIRKPAEAKEAISAEAEVV